MLCWPLVIVLGVRLSLARQLRQRWSGPYLLLAFFFLIGGIHGSLSQLSTNNPKHIRNLITHRQEASVIGTLLRSPEIGPEKTTLLVDSHRLIFPEKSAPTTGLVQLTIRGQIEQAIAPGDTIICRSWLAPVSRYGVPGTFNYRKFMADKSIWITGWTKSPLFLKRLPATEQSSWQLIRFWPQRLRATINHFITQTLPLEQAGIYKAILTGDRSSLSLEINESFKASGVAHLLAISGIHVGLLALICTFLFNLVVRRSEWLLLHISAIKLSALLSLFPVTLYALVAGFGPPVVRALCMVAVFIAALLCNRQWSIANNIAIAALIILTYSPQLIGTASFQLSFAAVIAISLFAQQIKQVTTATPHNSSSQPFSTWNKIFRWGLASLLISLIASLGTAPIVLTHFHRLSLLSPITTLIVEPMLCFWSLSWGLLAAIFLYPFPMLAVLLLKTGGLGITLAAHATTALAALPFASIWGPAPTLGQTVCWYGILILIALRPTQKFVYAKRGGIALCLLGLIAPAIIPRASSTETEIAVLDVGQGSAVVMHLPGNKTFLLDGGQKKSRGAKGPSVGEQIIAPYLWERGITTLDGVIVSHPDADHFSGVPFILQHFRPSHLWVNGADNEPKGKNNGQNTYHQLLQTARNRAIAMSVPSQGEVLYRAEDVAITALSSHDNGKIDLKLHSDNDESMVIRLEVGHRSFLFPSDIESQGESDLVQQWHERLKADVLIAPHHGSKTSSSPDLLKAVSPEYIVVSSEDKAIGTFPSFANLVAYKKIGSKVYLTADSGTVFLTTDGTNLEVATFFKPIPLTASAKE